LLVSFLFSIIFTFPFTTLKISTKLESDVSSNNFFTNGNSILNLSAPGAAKFVNPFALSYKDSSSFASTIDSFT